MEAGKGTPYVEDVIFPLVVRGPGVAAGAKSDELAQNTDLAPTFAELAGVAPPAKADGVSLAPLLRGEAASCRDAALVERPGKNRGFYGLITAQSETHIEWNSGFREYYDLNIDPYQLDNAFESKSAPPPDPQRIVELETQLEQLRTCKANTANTCQDSGAGTPP
jgi:N-acetylglucosamine-6-sulfatase